MPSNAEYMKRFIESVQQLLRRMRWKAYFFLNPTDTSTKETYGFKSRKSPKQVIELKSFEDDMLNMIQSIKFRPAMCSFQNQLSKDIKTYVKKPDMVLVPADKTTNFYALHKSSYQKLITENVTKTYMKSNNNVVKEINERAAGIARDLKLDDRVEVLAEKEAFVTLKDHKPEFQNHPTCRLINPTKSEIGIISKHILEDINKAIINTTQINQWKNTSCVLKWFNNLENKKSLVHIFRCL